MSSKTYQTVLATLAAMSLTACGGSSGSSTSGGGSSPTNPVVNKYSDTVTISQMSTIPTINGVQSGQVYYMAVHNDSANQVTLTSSSHVGDDVFDVHQCSVIQPDGICLISVKPDKENGRSSLKLSFSNKNNKKYETSQLVSYATAPENNGFYYSSNNLDIVGKESGKYFISVPIILGKDYSSLKVKSTTTPFYQSEPICSAGKYTKGNSCTVILGFKTPSSAAVKTTSKQLKSSDNTNHIAVTGVTPDGAVYAANYYTGISANNVANLLTNAVNLSVTAGSDSPTFQLLNSGVAAASSISINSESSDVVINGGNSCTSLSTGSTCSISLSTTAKQAGTTNVNITYNNGVETKTMSFHVTYYPATIDKNDVVLSAIYSQDIGAIYVNESKTTVITLKNASSVDVPLTGIKLTSTLPTGFSYDPSIVTSGTKCNLSGTSLNQGESCLVGVRYNPASINTTSSTFKIYAHGVANGTSYTASTPDIHYSSLPSIAPVTPNPSSADFSIRADNKSQKTETFTVNNSRVDSIQVTAITIPNVTGFTMVSDNCSNTIISPNGNCTFTVSYGPIDQDQAINDSITISSSVVDGLVLDPVTIPVGISATQAALITTTLESTPIVNPFSGFLYADPYLYNFVPTLGTDGVISLRYTLTNQGMIAAQNVHFSVNELPLGFYIDTANTTCDMTMGSVLESYTQTANNSCSVVVSFVDSQYFKYFANNSVMLGVLSPQLGITYKDANTGVNNTTTGVGASIAANTWMQLNVIQPQVNSTSHTITFEFSPTAINDIAGGINIATDFMQKDGFTLSSSNGCTNLTTGGTCQIVYSYAAGLPSGQYNEQVQINPVLNAGKIEKVQQAVTFNLSN